MEKIEMFQATHQIGYWFMVPGSWFMAILTSKSWDTTMKKMGFILESEWLNAGQNG